MYLITKEKYLQNLKDRFPNDDMTVLDPFTAASNPVDIRCNKCGHIYHYNHGTTLYNKRKKSFCPLCSSKSVIAMIEACKERNISIIEYGDNVIVPWKLRCNKCGFDFSRAPSTWLMYDCPNCGHNHNTISKEARQHQLDKQFGVGEFEILDEQPTNEKITVRHKCGFIRKTQISALLRSHGCPRCNKTLSLGERLIAKYLDEHKIPYLSQAKMGNTRQSFDFLIGNCAIEFNGKQHYMPIEIFGGKERFEQQKKYDLNKQEYCKENNINLLIISYLELEKINTILDNFFEKFNDQLKNVREN